MAVGQAAFDESQVIAFTAFARINGPIRFIPLNTNMIIKLAITTNRS